MPNVGGDFSCGWSFSFMGCFIFIGCLYLKKFLKVYDDIEMESDKTFFELEEYRLIFQELTN